MKTRKLLATVLGLGVLVCILFGLAAIAMYCDQVFVSGEIPALCVESSLARTLFNIAGWILLVAAPTAVWLLYVQFGWPRTRDTSGKM